MTLGLFLFPRFLHHKVLVLEVDAVRDEAMVEHTLVVQFAQSQAVNGTYWIWKSPPLSLTCCSLRWRYCHRPVSVINLIEGLCATWHLLVPPQFSVTQGHNVFYAWKSLKIQAILWKGTQAVLKDKLPQRNRRNKQFYHSKIVDIS